MTRSLASVRTTSIMRSWPWMGEYEYRYNPHADEDDRGGTTAWEVWHWPSETVESDWFTPADAAREVIRLDLAAQDEHREVAR